MANITLAALKTTPLLTSAASEEKPQSSDVFAAILGESQNVPQKEDRVLTAKKLPQEVLASLQSINITVPDALQSIKGGVRSVDIPSTPDREIINDAPVRRNLDRKDPAATSKRDNKPEHADPVSEPVIAGQREDDARKVSGDDKVSASSQSKTDDAELSAPLEDYSYEAYEAIGLSSSEAQDIVTAWNQQFDQLAASGDLAGLMALLQSFIGQLKYMLASAQKQLAGDAVSLDVSVLGVSINTSSFFMAGFAVGGGEMNQDAALMQDVLSDLSAPMPKSQSSLAVITAQWTQTLQQSFAGEAPSADMLRDVRALPQSLMSSIAQSVNFAQQENPFSADVFESLVAKLEQFQTVVSTLTKPAARPVGAQPQDLPSATLASSLAATSITPTAQAVTTDSVTTPGAAATNLQAAGAAAAATIVSSAGSQTSGDSLSDDNQRQPTQAIQQATSYAGQDASKGVSSLSFARFINQPDAKPISEQVLFHIKTALKDGSSKIHIQLDPVQLGKLEIKLHLHSDGRTSVIVTADQPETLALLQKDSANLERALSDAGLKADSGSLSFNLRSGQQERDGEQKHASSHYQKAMPDDDDVLPAHVLTRSYVVNMNDGLDIKI